MNKIGSWWLASYDAQAGEQMEWSALATHTQGPFRSISGKVYLSNQRLLFCPNLLDYVREAISKSTPPPNPGLPAADA